MRIEPKVQVLTVALCKSRWSCWVVLHSLSLAAQLLHCLCFCWELGDLLSPFSPRGVFCGLPSHLRGAFTVALTPIPKHLTSSSYRQAAGKWSLCAWAPWCRLVLSPARAGELGISNPTRIPHCNRYSTVGLPGLEAEGTVHLAGVGDLPLWAPCEGPARLSFTSCRPHC